LNYQFTCRVGSNNTRVRAAGFVSVRLSTMAFRPVFISTTPKGTEGMASADGEFRADVDVSIAAARDGSLSALGQLLDAYRGFLLCVAKEALATDVRPKLAASDLVQESLLQAVRDFPRFSGKTEAELRAWLKQVLLNNVCDAHRQYHKAERRDVSRETPISEPNSSASGLAVDSHPLSDLATREESLLVESTISSLGDEYRQVIELRSLEGLAFEEVGRRMNRSSEAARKLWSRAVEKLSHELRQKSVDGRTFP